MPEPVAFISRFRVKEGRLDGFRELQDRATAALQVEKPRTLVFLTYLNGEEARVAFIHAFADADAMDLHFEGAQERAGRAYEVLEAEGWEVYGSPSEKVLNALRGAADNFGVPLTVYQDYVGGFLRANAGDPSPPA